MENEWREVNCPGYVDLWCDSPYTCAHCDDAWSCIDVYEWTKEIMSELDTNGDLTATHDDEVASYKIDLLNSVCDVNNDGSTD